jgi:hypothetical protein
MKYVQCPRCRTRFHTGVIYEAPDACTRCGAVLPHRRGWLREQLRAIADRRLGRNKLDWEAITGSQYAKKRLLPSSPEHGRPQL